MQTALVIIDENDFRVDHFIALDIEYDPDKISWKELLMYFWNGHDYARNTKKVWHDNLMTVFIANFDGFIQVSLFSTFSSATFCNILYDKRRSSSFIQAKTSTV